jgi:pantoate kinase
MSKPDLTEFFESTKHFCKASRLIDKLEKEDQEKVEAALVESTIDSMSIVRFLQKRGLDAKHNVVIRHRKKECMCYVK